MAGNCSRQILMSLLLFCMALSLILPCYAARYEPAAYHIKDPDIGRSRPICPDCVCCKPPPPGSCCKCCAAPIDTHTIKGSP
ncbi:hypothetical protein MANES_11G030600v8 [Manihot esculenta]|uniref:Uncharacterized protein n=1 Tax=Manihot esculenta TaxID=3983 RepID=A0A2C9UXW8_MANES|nr:hypothetical protein MANES_11G030600v8 [Manihot esculenta]